MDHCHLLPRARDSGACEGAAAQAAAPQGTPVEAPARAPLPAAELSQPGRGIRSPCPRRRGQQSSWARCAPVVRCAIISQLRGAAEHTEPAWLMRGGWRDAPAPAPRPPGSSPDALKAQLEQEANGPFPGAGGRGAALQSQPTRGGSGRGGDREGWAAPCPQHSGKSH